MMNRTGRRMRETLLSLLALAILPVYGEPAEAGDDFNAWNVSGDWYTAGDAIVDPYNERRLFGSRGTGVLINARIGLLDDGRGRRPAWRDLLRTGRVAFSPAKIDTGLRLEPSTTQRGPRR